MLVFAATGLTLIAVLAGGLVLADRQRIRLRVERDWKWTYTRGATELRDGDYRVYVGCDWVEAGPLRLRWPKRVIDGRSMAGRQKHLLERASAHLERFELKEAEALLDEYAALGYVAGRNPYSEWDASRCLAARIHAARGDYRKAITTRGDSPEIGGAPEFIFVLSILMLNTGRATEVEAWTDALDGSVSPEPPLPDHALTLGEVLHRKDRQAEALACFRKAAESDPAGKVPSPGGMARAWLKNLGAPLGEAPSP